MNINKKYNVYIDWDGKSWDQFIGVFDESKFEIGQVYAENESYKLVCVDKEESDDGDPDKQAYYLTVIYK